MAKQLQITIPEPCHEGWDKMSPTEKGKFCGSCQKQVIDFSRMNDRELAQYFKKPSKTSVCGHFAAGQLDRYIDIPKKRIPWLRYFFQFLIPAFLMSLKVSAQRYQRRPGTTSTKPVQPIPMVAAENIPIICDTTVAGSNDKKLLGNVSAVCDKSAATNVDTVPIFKPHYNTGGLRARFISRINGKVTDEDGKPISAASIIVKGTGKGVASGDDGTFKLEYFASNEEQSIQVSRAGFDIVDRLIGAKGNDSLIIRLKRSTDAIWDGYVVINYSPKMSSLHSDTKPAAFSIFPSPVAAGGVLSVDLKKMSQGNYSANLIDHTGIVLDKQELYVGKRTKNHLIRTSFFAPGSYSLVLTNKKTGKKYSQTIIMQ